MCDSFGVGFCLELVAFRCKHGAQFGKIFDNAVMNNGQTWRDMRMRIALNRLAVGRPASVANADNARKRFTCKALFQIDQLAFRTATIKLAI